MVKRLKLEEIADFADTDWGFIEKDYPPLRDIASEEGRKIFILMHVLGHHRDASAEMQKAVEPMGHGLPLNENKLMESAVESIIVTLQTLRKAGFSNEMIEGGFRKRFGESMLKKHRK